MVTKTTYARFNRGPNKGRKGVLNTTGIGPYGDTFVYCPPVRKDYIEYEIENVAVRANIRDLTIWEKDNKERRIVL